MLENQPKPTYLKDYRKPDYLIPEAELHFEIFEERALVRANLKLRRRDATEAVDLLSLNGENLKLLSIRLDGRKLFPDEYFITDTHLKLHKPPSEFTLETEVEIKPQENKALEGLYRSGDVFVTQNESEGFRKITYFLDRPDAMSRFTTKIEADRSKYPVLLSNGNPVDSGNLEGGRHYVTFRDPFPKPCYLFALVAGDFAVVEDSFTTRSKRRVSLRFYVDKGNESRCGHAVECLKKAMKWDEKAFGLEYDLDTYMIVAVEAFNAGAMENKGLNIFNAQYVLADPRTATDADYERILSVIGHEYFHNWTGNRVTCRDWFQITLKEGLTIFRDQEFFSDLISRSLKRITDVRHLKDYQFVEDSGPNAHPIKPSSYIEVRNFYTSTVYEKGAEVIRMIQTLIGARNFRKGMKRFFELYDGQAVTTEEFVQAMEQASGRNLTRFRNWYHQVGTPVCGVQAKYDARKKAYKLLVKQAPPRIFKTKKVKPLEFPLSFGLLSPQGKAVPLVPQGEKKVKKEKTKILSVSKPRQVFVFRKVSAQPIPSLLRNFSAPVHLRYDYSDGELMTLLRHDTDLFNRYEAGQQLARRCLHEIIKQFQQKKEPSAPQAALDAYGFVLEDRKLDPAFRAEILNLPSVASLNEDLQVCDFISAFKARKFLIKSLAHEFEEIFLKLSRQNRTEGEYQKDRRSIGKRKLKNAALSYLIALGKPEHRALALKQFKTAQNMTDQLAALQLLCHRKTMERKKALLRFYEKWNKNPLVMNKWFAVQAQSNLPDTLHRVKKLELDPAFDIRNPNKVRSLIGVFCHNLALFHDESGAGYAYLADKILQIDPLNPTMAARLATAFHKYARLDPRRKMLMKVELSRIVETKGLSPDVYEIASKTLAETKAG